jgi:hypothetical protein
MPVTKTEVVSVRVPPDIKAALTAAAEAERRSLASMVEIMVLDYCRAKGVALPGDKTTTHGRPTARKPLEKRIDKE